MTTRKKADVSVLSGGGLILLGLIGIAGAVAVYRLLNGLGPSTNLNDFYPWGLWIAFDVMAGVALAAGGFAIAAAVYVFRWEKYKPIARPAILTAYLGYIIVAVGLFFDIGKPYTFWHPLVFWQEHSVMFEVVWCVVLYLLVLTFEFAPVFFRGIGKTELARKLHGPLILFPLVIAGITLSYFHQSSLGAVFLLLPAKLHHLWWTTALPYNFYLSAIAAGLAMVSFESIIAARVFGHVQHKEILQGLARGTALVLLVYLAVRLGDLLLKGNFGLALAGSTASLLFWLEIAAGAVLPMLLLATPAIRQSVGGIFFAQLLVIGGVVLNRFDVTFLAQSNGAGVSYFPSWQEIAITVGLISFLLFLYRLAALKLPVFAHGESER